MSYTKTKLFDAGISSKSVIAIPAWAQQMIDNGGEVNSTVDAYNKTPQLYRAVQMRANALAAMPFVLRKNDKLTSWIYPQSLSKILFELEASLLVSGAAYLLKLQPTNGGKRTVGLQFLNPTTMRTTYDHRTRETLFTQQIRNETFGPWTADRLVYMREFSFQDEVGAGIAPAKVALPAAVLRIAMSDFAHGFFSSGGQPLTLLSMQGNPPPQEIERTERFFKRTMQGVRNAWRVLAVRSEVTVTPITPALNTMAMEELQTVTTREIASAFGIPLSLLTSDSANYATAISDQRLFYENTIKARLQFYEEAFNTQLLNETQTNIRFTPESLSVYQEDEAERSNALVNLVNAGMPLRDAMLILGYSVEEVTGTDATVETVSTDAPVIIAKSKKPATVSLQEQLADEYANATHVQQVKAELKTWQRVAAKSIERGREFECLQIPPELETFIKSHLQEPSAYLEHVFEDGVIKSLVLQTKAEKAVAAKVRAVFKQYGNQIKAKAARGIVDHVAADEMFSTLAKRITPVLTNVYTTQIQATEIETGVPLDTERYKTAAQEWAEKYSFGELKSGLEATTITNVQRMVSKLVQDPSLTPAMVAAGLFPTFSDYRVAMIATTEVTRAKSAAVNGYYDGLTEDGLDVVRRWGTKLDEKVCPICGPLDNKKEETYKKKFNDGPPAHPNCRCRIGVEVKAENTEEERGEVIAPTIPKPKPVKPVAPKPVIAVPTVAPMQVVPPMPAIAQRKTPKEIVKEVITLGNSEKFATAKKNLAESELYLAEFASRYNLSKPISPYRQAGLRFSETQTPEFIAALAAYDKDLVEWHKAFVKARSEAITPYLAAQEKMQTLTAEIHKLFAVEKPVAFKMTGAKISGELASGVDFVNNVVSSTLTNSENLTARIVFNKASRAKANATTIFVRKDGSIDDMVHELGHILEKNVTTAGNRFSSSSYELLGEVAIRYRESRTIGESWEKLSKVTGNTRYGAKEVTKKDKFWDAYTGKQGNGAHASEIITQGLQHMLENPIGFADNDPAHLEFMLTLLRGSE